MDSKDKDELVEAMGNSSLDNKGDDALAKEKQKLEEEAASHTKEKHALLNQVASLQAASDVHVEQLLELRSKNKALNDNNNTLVAQIDSLRVKIAIHRN